jgi:hypothetical protein
VATTTFAAGDRPISEAILLPITAFATPILS